MTGCFQTTPFSCFLAFTILFLASCFITALFLLLFCLQHSKTWSEREGAEVGFTADREVSDRPWLPWVCTHCMGIHSSHICPCYLCSTNKTRQIPAQRLFVGKQIDEREHDKVKTIQHSHNFLVPHLHCKHERPRPVSLTLVKPGNKRGQVQMPSVTARLAPLQPAFLPPQPGDWDPSPLLLPALGPGMCSLRHHTGSKAGWLPGARAPDPTLPLLLWLVQM